MLRRCLKTNLKVKPIILLFIFIPAIYLIGQLSYDHLLRQYSRYYVLLQAVDLPNPPEKIIFLWTPMFGSYKGWSWGIGPNPVISDCGNRKIDNRCLITNHPSLLEKADVVLFSIQDLKQVFQMLRFFTFVLFVYSSNNTNIRSVLIFQSIFSHKSALKLASNAFPQLTPEIRRKQLWLLVWYESNIQLKVYEHITDEYVASFDGVFNGTLSYRKDSFISHNFYGKSCNLEKSPSNQFNDIQWEEINASAISKPRYY